LKQLIDGETVSFCSNALASPRPKALDKNKQALAVKLYDEKKHSVDQVCQIEASRQSIS